MLRCLRERERERERERTLFSVSRKNLDLIDLIRVHTILLPIPSSFSLGFFFISVSDISFSESTAVDSVRNMRE